MEDRYEIKGKIGQGGLGAVYKAHDVRMNREVAIKRIIANTEDVNLPEEATRQLIKEAGSLASLQHPNIVTIYDVGEDEDGPFVVMELLSGDTLEEAIERGSFTWLDFRELATQILEALIAAQELHIVHRDLKPSNIMLTWLPSGKFQVKIVDFGLAKLSAAPSLQTIDQSDGVFGSIYFMAPEQFERVPIDFKADLYAIGCVFYYALTGTYPFDGDSAAAVMASHLQHFTVPIQEVRDGIPLWACDWIMWHINRRPTDRPESARQSLQYFLENEAAYPDPPVSAGTPTPEPETSKRPKLNIPGGAPTPEVLPDPSPTQRVKTAAMPKPLLPPEGSKPSVHTKAQSVHAATKRVESSIPVEPITPIPIPDESNAADYPPGEKVQPVTPAPEPPLENVSTPETDDSSPQVDVQPSSSAPILRRATSADSSTPALQPATPAIAKPATLKLNTGTNPKPLELEAEKAEATPEAAGQPASSNTAEKKAAAPILKVAAKSPTAPLLKPAAAAATKPSLQMAAKATAPLVPTAKPVSPALDKTPVDSAPKQSTPSMVDKKAGAGVSAKKKGFTTGAKIAAAGGLAVLALILAYFLVERSKENETLELYNEMITAAAPPQATEVPVNERKLEILLKFAASVSSNADRFRVYKALYLAKATDGTDIDSRIAEFATTEVLIPDVRIVLLRDVLSKRNNPVVAKPLLKFARDTEDNAAAAAAIEATRFMATDENFSEFLEIIQTAQSDTIRKTAEENAAVVIKNSSAKPALGRTLEAAYSAAFNDLIRHAMLRLLGRVGGDNALAIAKQNLESSDDKNNIAAIVALATWADRDGYEALLAYLDSSPDASLRSRAYKSAYQFAGASQENIEENWTLLSDQTKTEEEQLMFIRGIAGLEPEPWNFAILEEMAKSGDSERVTDLAQRAISRLKEIEKTKNKKNR
ncbi:protein kinase domain-containing protein [Luteolibacter sp. AS25]|uniref:protein kinase domain-containing protein n=1 Tax=Luteolibacter sp. AS25 TaxID=3135776 RepID=UPI00398B8D62